MSTKITLSASEIAARISGNTEGLTMVDMKSIETYLQKREYREVYNKRPDVVAKRKERNRKQAQEMKETRMMIELLLAKQKGE